MKALAVFRWQRVGWDGTPLHGLKLTRFAKKFFQKIFLMQKDTEILEILTEKPIKEKLTYLQAASPASLFPLLENNLEQTTTAICGARCYELLQMSNRPSLLAKTLLTSKIWHSKMCSLTWHHWVTLSNVLTFRLVPLVRHTKDKEHGLLPTTSHANTTGGPTGLAGGSGNRKKLIAMFGEKEGKAMGCGMLNPEFAEYIMGYPPGWTEINTEQSE